MTQGPLSAAPAPDAAVFPFGKQRNRATLRGGIPAVLLAIALPIAGVVRGYGVGAWIFTVLWFLALGAAGAWMIRVGWVDRHAYLAFDATGVWWLHDRKARVNGVIPWASLDAAGLIRCAQRPEPQGQARKTDPKQKGTESRPGPRLMSLELFPTGGVDADEPVLAPLIARDQDPSRPAHLPEQRYRIGVPVFATRHYGSAVVAAARSHAGDRWFGEHERPAGHLRVQDLIS
ncbi:hypothetical protein [Streptomyces ochraceiscleroticus]|uniref:Uncharacterized protein n=1 Tax=Streptomyces ochraceiscleroticus TaxID=47761 RepID=A0ABW1MFE9_9ACTN|nr:hypothetical protein [Streptomyces ochraceiscleroticus]